MVITVIGTGFVGVVTSSIFAKFGNTVYGLDIDKEKIAKLTKGKVPFYEPGLAELVTKNLNAGRLRFTSDLHKAVDEALVVFVAVGISSGVSAQEPLVTDRPDFTESSSSVGSGVLQM